jgi:hypothetical protein
MNCIHCGKPAQAICRFCGRAVCKEHIRPMNYIESIFADARQVYRALVIADAVYCGICKPMPEPLELPALNKD